MVACILGVCYGVIDEFCCLFVDCLLTFVVDGCGLLIDCVVFGLCVLSWLCVFNDWGVCGVFTLV